MAETQHCRDPLAWRIVYHADPYTKFSMPAPDLVFDAGPSGAGPGKGVKELLDIQKFGDSADLYQSLMIHRLCRFPVEAGSVFSMEFAAEAFQSLTDVLQGSLPSTLPALEDVREDAAVDLLAKQLQDLDLLTHTAPNAREKGINTVFWKVVNISASKVKRPKLEHEIKLADTTLLVALHRLLDVDVKNKTMLISIDADNRETASGLLVPLVFSPEVLTSATLKTIKVWQVDQKEEFRLQDESGFTPAERHCLPTVLRRCVKEEGYDCQSSSMVVSTLLQKLVEPGLLEGPPWKLSQAGKASLQVGQRIHSFKEVFGAPNELPEDPLECVKLSPYELVQRLEAAGFQHQVVDLHGLKEATENPYHRSPEGEPLVPKVWYTRRDQMSVNPWYLVALLFVAKHGKPVPHFAKQSGYQSLLDPSFIPARKRVRCTQVFDAELAMLTDWPEDAPAPLPPKKRSRRVANADHMHVRQPVLLDGTQDGEGEGLIGNPVDPVAEILNAPSPESPCD